MLKITDITNLAQIFDYQMRLQSPCFFTANFESWKESFENDIDGEGRVLFQKLHGKAAYDGDSLIGFIQYGNTAFGFDDSGEISMDVSYPVIRSLYFDEGREDAGKLLLQEAMEEFESADKVYAFFHYFGMTCFARHGKLHEKHAHIAQVLNGVGFQIEHENVYYSFLLKGAETSAVQIKAHSLTRGNQQYLDFILSEEQVGGCEVHFLDARNAYLRWIYVNENMTGKGIGTKCMTALKQWLYQKGIARFDTDTALSNHIAQHYYEKNGFSCEGITRSYLYVTNVKG